VGLANNARCGGSTGKAENKAFLGRKSYIPINSINGTHEIEIRFNEPVLTLPHQSDLIMSYIPERARGGYNNMRPASVQTLPPNSSLRQQQPSPRRPDCAEPLDFNLTAVDTTLMNPSLPVANSDQHPKRTSSDQSKPPQAQRNDPERYVSNSFPPDADGHDEISRDSGGLIQPSNLSVVDRVDRSSVRDGSNPQAQVSSIDPTTQPIQRAPLSNEQWNDELLLPSLGYLNAVNEDISREVISRRRLAARRRLAVQRTNSTLKAFALFMAGILVLVFYSIWKHDLGAGAGLCALVWSAGGGAYSLYRSTGHRPWKGGLVLFLSGVVVLAVYKVWRKDLGTGAGLCSLIWTIGGGNSLTQKKENKRRRIG
jgi:hypothetical protein